MSIKKTNGESYHHMSYRERELLKSFARECAKNGDIESLESSLVMIAHFMRQRIDVPFSEYAGQWCAARNSSRLIATMAMRTVWPLLTERHIDDGGTDYQGGGWPEVSLDQRRLIRTRLAEWIANNPFLSPMDMAARGLFDSLGFHLSYCELEEHLRAMSISDEWPVRLMPARIVRKSSVANQGYTSRSELVYVNEEHRAPMEDGNIAYLMRRSIESAKNELERILVKNPLRALDDATNYLAYYRCPKSHVPMLQDVIGRAGKALAASSVEL